MKKKFLILSIILAMTSGIALADGMVFDPTEYQATTTKKGAVQSNASIEKKTQASSTYTQDAASDQNEYFDKALFELDSAQVNSRNSLLDYQAKYQEVDTQYKLIKEQRRVLGNQIKTLERQIKKIEQSKREIRETMI